MSDFFRPPPHIAQTGAVWPAISNSTEIYPGLILWCDPKDAEMHISSKRPETRLNVGETATPKVRPCMVIGLNKGKTRIYVVGCTSADPGNSDRWFECNSGVNPIEMWVPRYGGKGKMWIYIGNPSIVDVIFQDADLMRHDRDRATEKYRTPPISTANLKNWFFHHRLLMGSDSTVPRTQDAGNVQQGVPFYSTANNGQSRSQGFRQPIAGPSHGPSVSFPQDPNSPMFASTQYSNRRSTLASVPNYSRAVAGGRGVALPVIPHPQQPTQPLAPPTNTFLSDAPPFTTQSSIPSGQMMVYPSPAATVQTAMPPAGFTENHPDRPEWWMNPTTGHRWHHTRGIIVPMPPQGFTFTRANLPGWYQNPTTRRFWHGARGIVDSPYN
ncbi:hypothetical protein C8R43DRAFT_109060 [Mycena crocata]|nr:hypothetical protein C8R43DRAFT_109060 [Mycena crocata]